ncbi:hypothetical protein XELAEV_18026956mg [Xenopus laevis]|uniref:Uncharacterized protein n=1 Tax=Xenopus laevis TaxID=8355 RepID=A0A974CWQ8_XENLA|nr:hypothetical protein XELAEV_18026956mg [Xenopus laevis]
MRTAYSNDGQMVMCQSVGIIKSNNKCPYHSDSAITTCPRQERLRTERLRESCKRETIFSAISVAKNIQSSSNILGGFKLYNVYSHFNL